jgi:hypothetical protein
VFLDRLLLKLGHDRKVLARPYLTLVSEQQLAPKHRRSKQFLQKVL